MSYLLMLKGPNPGERFDLDREKTILGREHPACHVLLRPLTNDGTTPVVSRRHALLTRDEEGNYYIEDGDGAGRPSRNRTLVNGDKLPFPGKRRLHSDDIITVCDFALLFHDSSEADSSSIDGSLSNDGSSVFLTQPTEQLRLLLELTNRLNRTFDLDRLTADVVDVLLDLFRQADRAFLILVDEASGALVSRRRKLRKPDLPVAFSTKIVERCLKTVQGLLSNDARSEFLGSDSVAVLPVRSAICAPLWSQDRSVFGVLLIDTQNDRKPFGQADLNLLMGVASQASIALSNARFYRDSMARERMNRDLILARQVVRSFLPTGLPVVPGYDFFASNESALEVGGDYYDFIDVADERLAILVGDVAGKGVPAALVMARFSAEARACLRGDPDLAGAVRQLNMAMQPLGATDRFVTLAALLLDPAAHTITVVNAGHPSPLVLRRATGALESVTGGADAAPPLGILDDHPFEKHVIALEPGDSVVLFSDGVTDALNVAGGQFGLAALRTVLQNGGTEPSVLGERVLQAVKEHAAGCAQYDDLTLVCVGRTAPDAADLVS
jgi:phosphoserine phosphatase RsbU/P